MGKWDKVVAAVPADRPVLIAGPTASGKSELALAIAQAADRPIINADALQVYADWRILTARPSDADLALAPHFLYGHVDGQSPYSVGDWLRDAAPYVTVQNPVFVGGTGLYFAALTDGLAEIPATPQSVRATATARLDAEGADALLAEIDTKTAARIDRQNPMRIQRAWEVLTATGRGLAAWQDDTGPPVLPLSQVHALVVAPPREALAQRIATRFDAMLDAGVMTEVAANAAGWDPAAPSSKAIGAAELMAHHQGAISLDEARERVVTLTRQYAKRQRSWLRSRMSNWTWVDPTL